MNTKKIAALVVLSTAVAGVAGGVGYWLALRQKSDQVTNTTGSTVPAERKPLYWYDPMVPTQRFDKPGKSPFMDMELVPRFANEYANAESGDGEEAAVSITPGVMQNLAIRLATVKRGPWQQTLVVAATTIFNERDVAVVQARGAGFVERVYARAPGDVIARGAPLVDLRLPEWGGAQTEFLSLVQSGDAALVAAARDRLRSLGMSSELIAHIEKSGQPNAVITISSPVAGVIQTLDARAGMTVAMGSPLAKVNGVSSVWLEAAVPEALSAAVKPGRMVEARFSAYPGEVFKGKVGAVLPENNADSRTLRVRIEMENRSGRIRPGMFAQVRLDSGDAAPALFVPSEAVIRTGTRTVVILGDASGHFTPAEIVAGREAEGNMEILKGLDEGQQVVASGQFLIDSEASLSATLNRLSGKSGDMKLPGADHD